MQRHHEISRTQNGRGQRHHASPLEQNVPRHRYAFPRPLCFDRFSTEIGTDIDGIKIFAQAVLEKEPWLVDPKTPEIEWREGMCRLEGLKGRAGEKRRMVLGVMAWDGVVRPHPPVRRALEMTVEAVKRAGYEGASSSPCV